jgi:hypothetical protein
MGLARAQQAGTVTEKRWVALRPSALKTLAVRRGVVPECTQAGAVQLTWLVSVAVVAVESVPVFAVQEKERPLA